MAPEDSIRPADHEAVLASLLEAVVAFGPSGRVSYVNPAAEVLLGRSRRALLGHSADEVFRSSPWLAEVLRRVGPDHPAVTEEGEIATPSGPASIVAEATAVREKGAASAAAVLALYDLTRRTEMQHQDHERRRIAALDRMAAQFAHEINNPLSGIRGAAQLLGRRLADRGDLVEYTDMIVRQVDRLSGLVEALMALEAPLLRKEPVNIHRVLNEIMLLERPTAEQRGIVFEPAFDPSLPDVTGDPARLEQLFLNIVRNAIDHCPEHLGRIRISTRMEHAFYVDRESGRVSYLTVSIADNGPGLAIAGAIATAHEGRIRAANAPGGGAVFHVTLPIERARDACKGETR